MVVRWVRLPYTIALVISGLAVGLLDIRPLEIQLTPQLVFDILLPPLLFEAAFHLDWDLLARRIRSVSSLPVIGVAVSTLIVGAILHLGLAMEWSTALLFGALISATDPVAVVATLRRLGAPRDLGVIMEGESLFNDGMALVLFRSLAGMAVVGTVHPAEGVLEFVQVAAGGLVLGLTAGLLFSHLVRLLDDYLIEVTLTTILAYGTFLLAESFHVSGVIAVVGAGLVAGNYGARVGMSPTTLVNLYSFWEYFAFLVNSLVFLLIGIQVDVGLMRANLVPILWALGAVLVGRGAVVYALTFLVDRFGREIPLSWRHMLVWGGLRGAIALAMALSLPPTLPGRETLFALAFGVVLFSLLVQGLTIQPLLRALGLRQEPGALGAVERTQARLLTLRAGHEALRRLQREGLVSPRVARDLLDQYRFAGERLAHDLETLFHEHEELEREQKRMALREALTAERAELRRLLTRGLVSEEIYEELSDDLAARLSQLRGQLEAAPEEVVARAHALERAREEEERTEARDRESEGQA